MKITHTLDDVTEWFFATLDTLLQTREIVMVGLAGGASYDQFYNILLEKIKNKEEIINKEVFKNIRWCLTDERVNCPEKDRNDAHIWEVFLGPLCEMGFSEPEYFIRPSQTSTGREYSELIIASNLPYQGGGEKPLFSLDIAFFGMGPDGHTASIFPHSAESKIPPYPPLSRGHFAEYIDIKNSPKPPPERISLSPRSLGSLQNVCLFAVGASKKEALANFFDESVSIIDCPAKLLKPEIMYDATKE